MRSSPFVAFPILLYIVQLWWYNASAKKWIFKTGQRACKTASLKY